MSPRLEQRLLTVLWLASLVLLAGAAWVVARSHGL